MMTEQPRQANPNDACASAYLRQGTRQIRAILFDKDGTLVDFQRTWGPAVDEVIRRLAAGNRAVYEQLSAASRFIGSERRFLPDSPIIGEPTNLFGARWAEVLGCSPSAAFFAEINRLLC